MTAAATPPLKCLGNTLAARAAPHAMLQNSPPARQYATTQPCTTSSRSPTVSRSQLLPLSQPWPRCHPGPSARQAAGSCSRLTQQACWARPQSCAGSGLRRCWPPHPSETCCARAACRHALHGAAQARSAAHAPAQGSSRRNSRVSNSGYRTRLAAGSGDPCRITLICTTCAEQEPCSQMRHCSMPRGTCR